MNLLFNAKKTITCMLFFCSYFLPSISKADPHVYYGLQKIRDLDKAEYRCPFAHLSKTEQNSFFDKSGRPSISEEMSRYFIGCTEGTTLKKLEYVVNTTNDKNVLDILSQHCIDNEWECESNRSNERIRNNEIIELRDNLREIALYYSSSWSNDYNRTAVHDSVYQNYIVRAEKVLEAYAKLISLKPVQSPRALFSLDRKKVALRIQKAQEKLNKGIVLEEINKLQKLIDLCMGLQEAKEFSVTKRGERYEISLVGDKSYQSCWSLTDKIKEFEEGSSSFLIEEVITKNEYRDLKNRLKSMRKAYDHVMKNAENERDRLVNEERKERERLVNEKQLKIKQSIAANERCKNSCYKRRVKYICTAVRYGHSGFIFYSDQTGSSYVMLMPELDVAFGSQPDCRCKPANLPKGCTRYEKY